MYFSKGNLFEFFFFFMGRKNVPPSEQIYNYVIRLDAGIKEFMHLFYSILGKSRKCVVKQFDFIFYSKIKKKYSRTYPKVL